MEIAEMKLDWLAERRAVEQWTCGNLMAEWMIAGNGMKLNVNKRLIRLPSINLFLLQFEFILCRFNQTAKELNQTKNKIDEAGLPE